MNTVQVVPFHDAFAVIVNGVVIAADLSNADAWREAERHEAKTVENTTDKVWRYQRQR